MLAPLLFLFGLICLLWAGNDRSLPVNLLLKDKPSSPESSVDTWSPGKSSPHKSSADTWSPGKSSPHKSSADTWSPGKSSPHNSSADTWSCQVIASQLVRQNSTSTSTTDISQGQPLLCLTVDVGICCQSPGVCLSYTGVPPTHRFKTKTKNLCGEPTTSKSSPCEVWP